MILVFSIFVGLWLLLWGIGLWSLWARVDALEKRRPPSPESPAHWEDPATGCTYAYVNGAWRVVR
jgi:hypothetical protein